MRRSPLLVEETRNIDLLELPPFGPMMPGSSRAGVTVAPGVSNTLGAWVQMIASTVADANWLHFNIGGGFISGQNIPMLADIAIGAAASEVVIVSSIHVGQVANGHQQNYLLPVFVPAGSRVSLRLTTAHATPPSPITYLALVGRNRQFPLQRSPSSLVPLGANVAASDGVRITQSNTWTEIAAATPQAFRALQLTWGASDNQLSAANEKITFGIGAAGAEVTLGEYVYVCSSTENISARVHVLPVCRHIPAGTRVVAKTSVGINFQMGVVVQGVPY